MDLSQEIFDLQKTDIYVTQTAVQTAALKYTKPRKREEIDLLATLTVLHIVQSTYEAQEKRQLLKPLQTMPIQCLPDKPGEKPVARFFLSKLYRKFLASIRTILETQNLTDLDTPIEEPAAQKLNINIRETLLHRAAALGLPAACQALYLLGAKNIKDSASLYPIHHAAANNASGACQVIVDEDFFQVNQTTGSGSTPLHFAAQFGGKKVVETLIVNGAAKNVQNFTKQVTPLHLAALQGNEEIIKALLEHNTSIAMITKKLNTVFHCAARSGNVGVLTQLHAQDHLKLIQSQNGLGNTPAHIAAQYGHQGAYVWLLGKAPGSAEIKNKEGKTPLECGSKEFKKAIRKLQSINKP